MSDFGPEWDAWAREIRDDLIPKIDDSALGMVIAPPNDDDYDIRQAVEIGLMILMDKPVIAVVPPGHRPSHKLAKIADRIIVGNPGDEGMGDRLKAAMDDLTSAVEP